MAIVLLPAWGMGVPRGMWRARVRAELGDETAPYLWADALLDTWLAEALAALSLRLPREARWETASVAGQAVYPLPLGVLTVLAVEHPAGPPWLPSASGGAERAGAGTFRVWQGQLWLRPAPTVDGAPIRVWYLARRPAPSADSDPLPVEAGDEELLLLYVCARALAWVSGQEAKRQVVERQRGADALALAAYYERQYREGLAARAQLSGRPRRVLVS
ncbi:MAG TPA: hypothetical protein VKZ60_19965 [Chloroflexota bacterium]|nr:hypothetical protein [Chloroflexota bacterium]